MSIVEVLIAIAAIGVSVAFLLGLTWFIPSCLRSVFRYRLWRIRDSLYDDVASGKLPDEEVVSELVNRIEEVIRLSRHVTLYKFVASGVITSWDMRDAKAYEDAKQQALSPEYREQLGHYEWELAKVMVIHLLGGSPSGWIGSILLTLYFAYSSFRAGDRHLIRGLKRQSAKMGQSLSSEEKINHLKGETKSEPDRSMSVYAN